MHSETDLGWLFPCIFHAKLSSWLAQAQVIASYLPHNLLICLMGEKKLYSPKYWTLLKQSNPTDLNSTFKLKPQTNQK